MSIKKSSSEARKQQKFNVYAGGGVFLSALSHESVTQRCGRADGSTQTSFTEIQALALPRNEAIAACRMARKQGVPAWLVPADDFVAFNRLAKVAAAHNRLYPF